VGRPHGLDGSFYVEAPAGRPLAEGTEVTIGDRAFTIDRRAGTDAKPIVRVEGVGDRDGAAAMRGQTIGATGDAEPPGEDEWLIADLVGCRIEGIGEVTAVLEGLSCDVLEAGGQLIPLVTDAVTRVDVDNKVIEVDREFLGL
jgi:16S rRNA processing protein RimM